MFGTSQLESKVRFFNQKIGHKHHNRHQKSMIIFSTLISATVYLLRVMEQSTDKDSCGGSEKFYRKTTEKDPIPSGFIKAETLRLEMC